MTQYPCLSNSHLHYFFSFFVCKVWTFYISYTQRCLVCWLASQNEGLWPVLTVQSSPAARVFSKSPKTCMFLTVVTLNCLLFGAYIIVSCIWFLSLTYKNPNSIEKIIFQLLKKCLFSFIFCFLGQSGYFKQRPFQRLNHPLVFLKPCVWFRVVVPLPISAGLAEWAACDQVQLICCWRTLPRLMSWPKRLKSSRVLAVFVNSFL